MIGVRPQNRSLTQDASQHATGAATTALLAGETGGWGHFAGLDYDVALSLKCQLERLTACHRAEHALQAREVRVGVDRRLHTVGPCNGSVGVGVGWRIGGNGQPVSYTHLRAHETRHDLVCRLLLEKKK